MILGRAGCARTPQNYCFLRTTDKLIGRLTSMKRFLTRLGCTPELHTLIAQVLLAMAIALVSSGTLYAQSSSPPDFSGTGRQSSTGGGGSRGNCPDDKLTMTPLVPVTEEGGWTTAEQPTVWVYVNSEFDLSDRATFVVKDAEGRIIYTHWLSHMPYQTGIYQFAFPDSVTLPLTALEGENQDAYTWEFNVSCDAGGGDIAIARGSVRRVEIDLMTVSGNEPLASLPMSNAYVDHRIWYDALTTLGEARMSSPDDPDFAMAWQQLLSYPTVGLEAIATEPLVDCCTLPAE
jgi:hypothetical protein